MQFSPINDTMYSSFLQKNGQVVVIEMLKHTFDDPSPYYVYIDTLEGTGRHPTLRLNHKRCPVVSYSDIERGLLKIAVCEDIDCTTFKSTTFIIGIMDMMMDMAWHPTLGINEDNHPVLSYFNSREGNASIIICDDPICTDYATRIIDTSGSVGPYPDLQFTKDNHPVIGFYDYQNGDVKLIICGTPTCSSHVVRTIDTVGNVRSSMLSPHLQRNKNGYLVMAYFDAKNEHLKLAVCGDTLCTNTTINTVAFSKKCRLVSLTIQQKGASRHCFLWLERTTNKEGYLWR